MSEQTEFLKDLDIDQAGAGGDVLSQPLDADAPAEPKPDAEADGMQARNRRERRLIEQNQRLREEAIAASARAQALSETAKFREEAGDDYIKEVRAIYGEADPGSKVASDILEKTLRRIEETAVEKAVERLEASRAGETRATAEAERSLESILESVEEAHGLDMGSETERRGFLSLLEKVSPKDADGNIIEYADPDATAELYLSRRERANGRAREAASRSMARSGASQPSKLDEDATLRMLRDNGIDI